MIDYSQFNGLTPAESERLYILLEELGEAQQAIGKILRHGYFSSHPKGGGYNNKEQLEKELGDVYHAIIRLCEADDLDKKEIHEAALEKEKSIIKYLHHQ